MGFRKLLLLCCLAAAMAFALANGCKDLGSPLPPTPVITRVTPAADTIGAGIRIEGAHFGSSQGDSRVLFGTAIATTYTLWQDDEIRTIVPNGATQGLVKVVVGGQESNGVVFQVLGVFGVGQKNVNLAVGDSLVQTIFGGTPPHLFVSRGDTMKAAVSISGVSLKIRGVAAGSSTVIIGDNGVPQLRDTIDVSISAPGLISYASQVQPIFTTFCVNAGCHPGGGAPFSLQAGQSRGNIVGVTATNSPLGCAGGPFRVQAFSADASVLYHRISGTSCDFQMPLNRTPLSTANQNLIRDWINQGAQNN